MCQEKMKFCRNVRERSGNFPLHPDDSGMFGLDYFSC